MARRLTANMLARKVGLTENAIRKLESGSSKEPRFSTGMRIAAELGVRPQSLIGMSGKTSATGPELATVIRRLRAARETLERNGAGHLSVFGSVARGESTPASDVDLIVFPANPKRFSLLDLGQLTDVVKDILGAPADVHTEKTIAQSRFAQSARDDAVSVF